MCRGGTWQSGLACVVLILCLEKKEKRQYCFLLFCSAYEDTHGRAVYGTRMLVLWCQKWDKGHLEDDSMEQSIGEAERAIQENRIMLERLTSEMTRRSRAPQWPNGASFPRALYRSTSRGQNEPPAIMPTLQIHSRLGSLPRSPAKLPRFNGLMPLEPYLGPTSGDRQTEDETRPLQRALTPGQRHPWK
ncbi:hypothetical protein DPX16_21341 [Anabarilius grahami]|uniref:Uncharacterized protein n=1 Tax=Anabarilius grahami TaxID=495550 RepID=A0A3N0XEQ2_ANAGA|nr:hypothetical protein DPX16_21341 [Anabarilius grahami]